MELPFKDVQYVYTNKCTLAEKTNYCTVSNHIVSRANMEQIKKACNIFKQNNLQVKVLGGNPSDENDFEEFIKYMNHLDLDYVITDNAINGYKLANYNFLIKGLIFSLDTLGKSNIGGCSYEKSMHAKRIIPYLENHIKYIGANVIINSLNISEIPEIIEFLTNHNAITNLCPLIVGKNKNFVFRISDSPYSLDKIKNRYDIIKTLVLKLLEMKKSGYKIGVPDEYLENLPDAIKKKGWGWNCYHINEIPILRINVDLSLMVCSDLCGSSISKYSVFDIEDKFDKINRSWVNDSQRISCCSNNGCYWSNIVIADIYRRKGYGTLEATRRNL